MADYKEQLKQFQARITAFLRRVGTWTTGHRTGVIIVFVILSVGLVVWARFGFSLEISQYFAAPIGIDGEPTDFYYRCVNQACVEVPGTQADQCASDQDCGAPQLQSCGAIYGGDAYCHDRSSCPSGTSQGVPSSDCTICCKKDPVVVVTYTCTAPKFCYTGPGSCPQGNFTSTSGTCQSGNCCVETSAPATHLECRNNSCVQVSGAGSDQCSSNAQCQPSALSATLSASPSTVREGDVVTLTWSSSGMTSCTALAGAGFSTGGATSGTDQSAPISVAALSDGQVVDMFSIQCTGAGGSRNAVASLTVDKSAPPADQHLECVNQTCTLVSGAGDNVCGPAGTACGVSGAGICQGSTRIVEEKDGVVVCLLSSTFSNDRCTTIASGTIQQTLGIYNGSGQNIYSRPALFYTPNQTCGAHADNPSGTGGIVSGDTNIAPGQSGQVTYTFTVPDNCGSWQLDDTWGPGSGYFVIGKVINTGKNCTTTVVESHRACQNQACVEVSGAGADTCSTDAQCQSGQTHLACQNNACVSVAGAGTNQCTTNSDCQTSQTLACAPTSQSAQVDEEATILATGGTGTYSWSAQSGDPSNGSGNTFKVTYAAEGDYEVTVTSGNEQAICMVQVRENIEPEPLTCSPASQNRGLNQFATVIAYGGSGQYSWEAPDGDPDSGSGSDFDVRYDTPGTYDVTVTDDGTEEDDVCSVVVTPTPTVTTTIVPGSPALQILKEVRNITQGGSRDEVVSANPGDTVEFYVRVRSVGEVTAEDVELEDILPSGLDYISGSTEVDGDNEPNGIVSGGIDLGDMDPGDSIVVTFRARVEDAGFFNTGGTTLVNLAIADASNTPPVDDVAFVTVFRNPASPVLSIQKFGRNATRGEFGERSSVVASPNETIEFTIRVRNVSGTPATNVIVRDLVPSGVTYQPGSATLNGQPTSDSLVSSGVNIGTLSPGQEAVVRFFGRVAPSNALPQGTTTLINVAQTWADGVPTIQAQLPIIISSQPLVIPPADYGPAESTVLALIISAIITLLYVGYTSTDAFRRREAGSIAERKSPDFRN